MARDSEFAVRTQGLNSLNRALGKIDRDLKRQSVAHLRGIAKQVRGTAAQNAPRRSGKLASSLRYSANQRGAQVTSTLVYSPIAEYGGTISPRGTPIVIPRSRFVGRAIQSHARGIEEELGDLLDRIGRQNGFR